MKKFGWLLGGLALGVTTPALADAAGWAGLERFSRAWGWIQTWYVDPPAGDAMVDNALHAVAKGLDPHSNYYTADEWAAVEAKSRGTAVGIGADLVVDPCGLRVLAVSQGAPAERAGLRAGDCIVSIAGSVARDPAQLDGPAEEAVSVEVVQGETRRTAIVLRTRLTAPVVTSELVKGGVGWVRLASFRPGAKEELGRALDAMPKAKGLVLDLRQNGGGDIEEAVAVANRFLGAGDIVKTEGRGPGATKAYAATDDTNDVTLPIVVLVDGGSASASEIVAGALRARGRATLLGDVTYGKGTVQTVLHGPDGSALQLTIARYVLPDGTRLEEGKGLSPDVAVSLDSVPSPMLALRERVRAVPGLSPADRTALLAQVDAVGPSPSRAGVPNFGGSVDDRVVRDPQLKAAIERIRQLITPQ